MKKYLAYSLVLLLAACSDNRRGIDVGRSTRTSPYNFKSTADVQRTTPGLYNTSMRRSGNTDPELAPFNPGLQPSPSTSSSQPRQPDTKSAPQKDPNVEVLQQKYVEALEQIKLNDAKNQRALQSLQTVSILRKKDLQGLSLEDVLDPSLQQPINNDGQKAVSWQDVKPVFDAIQDKMIRLESIAPEDWTPQNLEKTQDYLDLLLALENNARGPYKDELLKQVRDYRDALQALEGLMLETFAGGVGKIDPQPVGPDEITKDKSDVETGKDIDKEEPKEKELQEEQVEKPLTDEQQRAQLEKQLQQAIAEGASDQEIQALQDQLNALDATQSKTQEDKEKDTSITDSKDQQKDESQESVTEDEQEQPKPEVDLEIKQAQKEIDTIDHLIAYAQDPEKMPSKGIDEMTPLTKPIQRALMPYTQDLECATVADAQSIIDELSAPEVLEGHALKNLTPDIDQTLQEIESIEALLKEDEKIQPELLQEKVAGPVADIIEDNYDQRPETLEDVQNIVEKAREDYQDKAVQDVAEQSAQIKEELQNQLATHQQSIEPRAKDAEQSEVLLDAINDPKNGLLNGLFKGKAQKELLTDPMRKMLLQYTPAEEPMTNVGHAMDLIKDLQSSDDPQKAQILDALTKDLQSMTEPNLEAEKVQNQALSSVLSGESTPSDIADTIDVSQPLEPKLGSMLEPFATDSEKPKTLREGLEMMEKLNAQIEGEVVPELQGNAKPFAELSLGSDLADYKEQLQEDKKTIEKIPSIEVKQVPTQTKEALIQELTALKDAKTKQLELKIKALAEQDTEDLALYQRIDQIIENTLQGQSAIQMDQVQAKQKLFQILQAYSEEVNLEVLAEQKIYAAPDGTQYEMIQLVLPSPSQTLMDQIQSQPGQTGFINDLRGELNPALEDKGLDYLIVSLKHVFESMSQPNVLQMKLPRMVMMNTGLKGNDPAYKFLVLQYLDAMKVNLGSIPFTGDGRAFQVNVLFAIEKVQKDS